MLFGNQVCKQHEDSCYLQIWLVRVFTEGEHSSQAKHFKYVILIDKFVLKSQQIKACICN